MTCSHIVEGEDMQAHESDQSRIDARREQDEIEQRVPARRARASLRYVLASLLALQLAVGCGEEGRVPGDERSASEPDTDSSDGADERPDPQPEPDEVDEESEVEPRSPATDTEPPAAPAKPRTLDAGVESKGEPARSNSVDAGKPTVDEPASKPERPATAGDGLVRGPAPTPESASRAGPYKVAQITQGFRNGPDFRDATIYYPADAEPPYAMIVFCPGFLGTQASDRPWGPFMASHGIVFMNIDTNSTSDSVQVRTKAELDALESLKAENTREGSPLKGKLALDRFGLMGWSMGGGAAWLNGVKNPMIKTVVTLAGHNATAGGARPSAELTVPTLMLAGTADTAVLGLGMSQPVYEVIPDSTPKLLYEVRGADHFDFNNPAYMNGIPARYALSWQKVFLEGDMRYYGFLLEKGPMASDFRSNLK